MSSSFQAKFLSWLRRDWPHLRLGIKGSVPPAILVCLIASNAWLDFFQTNSVFGPVIAACALPILPRARLIRLHIQLAFGFALSYAYCLFAGWCSHVARVNNTPPDAAPDAYNGSAEAIIGIFFVFYFWACFTLKSGLPTWQVPCVLSGLYAAAVLPALAQTGTMEGVLSIANNIIEAFLAGLGLAFAVGLVLFPQSSHSIFLNDIRACLDGISTLAKTHIELMDECATLEVSDQEDVLVSKLQQDLRQFLTNANNASADLHWAKQEISWSKLGFDELEQLHSSVMNLVPLASGIVSVAEMLLTSRKKEAVVRAQDQSNSRGSNEDASWQEARHEVHTYSKTLCKDIAASTERVLQLLDVAAGKLYALTENADGAKLETKDSSLASDALVERYVINRSWLDSLSPVQQHARIVHHYMILSELRIFESALFEVGNLLQFTAEISQNSKTFQFPFSHPTHASLTGIRRGKPYNAGSKKRTAYTQGVLQNTVRTLSQVLSSKHAGFGVRGTLAMMTVGILAFLQSSADFYSEQRFIWALYAVLLSLNETAGSSTQSLCFRFAGTVASMLASYVIWYLPDQHTAGILVFLWLWFVALGYLYSKFPRIQSAWFVALIAAIVMVANELLVRRLGKATVEETGQAVYKPYILFPYRLAIVTLGIIIAYFWTWFPIPLTEHREIRRNIAQAILSLAKFHLAVQESIRNRLSHNRSLSSNNDDAEDELLQARRRHFSSFQQHTSRARSYVKFLNWEWNVGMAFPQQTAAETIDLIDRIGAHVALIECISSSLQRNDISSVALPTDLEDTKISAHLCPKGIASQMIDFSNAVAHGQPLVLDREQLMVPDLKEFLDLHCRSNKFYTAATLIHATNWYIIEELNTLARLVTNVVGLLSFQV